MCQTMNPAEIYFDFNTGQNSVPTVPPEFSIPKVVPELTPPRKQPSELLEKLSVIIVEENKKLSLNPVGITQKFSEMDSISSPTSLMVSPSNLMKFPCEFAKRTSSSIALNSPSSTVSNFRSLEWTNNEDTGFASQTVVDVFVNLEARDDTHGETDEIHHNIKEKIKGQKMRKDKGARSNQSLKSKKLIEISDEILGKTSLKKKIDFRSMENIEKVKIEAELGKNSVYIDKHGYEMTMIPPNSTENLSGKFKSGTPSIIGSSGSTFKLSTEVQYPVLDDTSKYIATKLSSMKQGICGMGALGITSRPWRKNFSLPSVISNANYMFKGSLSKKEKLERIMRGKDKRK
ncbi:hypothetical protein HK096_004130 [Nowakowskiella sp. JEL0078]|nr:hypothetical protein HK096_004130 [Nowakowskiella sp. JEL0078]